jgi:hypothetical protein
MTAISKSRVGTFLYFNPSYFLLPHVTRTENGSTSAWSKSRKMLASDCIIKRGATLSVFNHYPTRKNEPHATWFKHWSDCM